MALAANPRSHGERTTARRAVIIASGRRQALPKNRGRLAANTRSAASGCHRKLNSSADAPSAPGLDPALPEEPAPAPGAYGAALFYASYESLYHESRGEEFELELHHRKLSKLSKKRARGKRERKCAEMRNAKGIKGESLTKSWFIGI